MNIELLQQIKAHILAEPDAFRMDTWTCGTAHCIAGWALKLSDTPIVNPEAGAWFQRTARGDQPAEAAARALGLEIDDYTLGPCRAERLFHVDEWPDKFAIRYGTTADRVQRAQIAADRIDHFIATDGRA